MLTKLGYHLLLEASHDSYIWSQVSLLSFPMHFAYFCITALIISNCPCEFTCPFLLLYQVSWGLGMNTQDMYYGWHIKCLNNKLIDGLIKDNNHLLNTLPQRLATFLCKGPDSEYFRLCEPYGLCHNYTTTPMWCESSHR